MLGDDEEEQIERQAPVLVLSLGLGSCLFLGRCRHVEEEREAVLRWGAGPTVSGLRRGLRRGQ